MMKEQGRGPGQGSYSDATGIGRVEYLPSSAIVEVLEERATREGRTWKPALGTVGQWGALTEEKSECLGPWIIRLLWPGLDSKTTLD